MSVNQNNNRLVIPNKRDPSDPNNLEVIERWANSQVVNSLVAGTNVTLTAVEQTQTPYGNPPKTGIITIDATGGGGFTPYASLTGPGETTTPGNLTQVGGFTVDAPSTDPIALNQTGNGSYIRIDGTTGEIDIFTNTGAGLISVLSNGSIGVTAGEGIAIEADGAGGVSIVTPSGAGAGPILIQTNESGVDIDIQSAGALAISSTKLGFFSATPSTLITVTGSRGGNAALASLLTALADYGLIVDHSS